MDGAATQSSIKRTASVTAAPTKHARRVPTGLAGVIIQVEMATRAQPVWQTVARASIAADAIPRVWDHARAARMHHRMHTISVRALSIRTTVGGGAIRRSSITIASATAAPSKHVLQVSIDQARVTTRAAMATSVTAASQTAVLVGTEAAVLVQVLDRAVRAPTHCRQTPPTQARDPLIQTTARGHATPHFIRTMASASAAPIKAVEQTSIAQGHAVTRAATATSALTARRTVPQVNIVAAAAARVLAHAKAAPISLRTHTIQLRAL